MPRYGPWQRKNIARFRAMTFVFGDFFAQGFCGSLHLLGIHGHAGQFRQLLSKEPGGPNPDRLSPRKPNPNGQNG